MVRQASMWVLLSGMLLAWGCEQKGESPSPFKEGIDVDGRRLVPIKSPTRKLDKSMIAAAASADEASSRKPAAGTSGTGGSEAAAIVIDASTPEGIVKAFLEIVASGNLIQLPDVLVPEQESVVRPAVATIAPVAEAIAGLRTAWTSKFADDPFLLAPLLESPLGGATFTASEVTQSSDQEAETKLVIEGAQPPIEVSLKLKLVEGNWKIEHPVLTPQAVALSTSLAPKLTEGFNNVATRIASGELATAKDAEEAIKLTILSAVQSSQGVPPPGDAAPTPEETPPNTPTDDADARRQGNPSPDPLDGTYTGPNQLRNR